MLKMMGKGEKDGREIMLVMLGLSHGNLDELRKNRPIIFDGEVVGLPNVEFIIFSGESERSMQRDFMDLVGPKTKLHIDQKLKD